MTTKYNFNCYENKEKPEIIKFKSEKEIEEIPITYETYIKFFPKIKGEINYQKLRISNIGLYSITRPKIAEKICKIIIKIMKTKNLIITDAMGNMGGMTITFAKYFDRVNTCEIMPKHCDILENNIRIYNLEDKINIYCGDYFDFMNKLDQDVVFFDPPWGGTDYHKKKFLSMNINNVNIICVINSILKNAKFFLLKVPFNYNFNDLRLTSQYKYIVTLDKNNKKSEILIIIKGKK